jgi:ABC-type nitrate/sulfonate/bicarbonate transport system substrate-binding protein
MSKNWIIVLVALVVVGGYWLWAENRPPEELETVRVGLQTTPVAALAKVAAEKGFFADEGINVEISEFTGGKFALQAMIGGSLDLVTPAEFPIMLALLNGEKILILTEMSETVGGFPMLLRKEGGENFEPEKYFSARRKIATSVGASPEFFTAEFFRKYNIPASQYELVSMKPEDMPIALANGDIDGLAIYEPFNHFAIQRAGEDNLFILKEPDLYAEVIVLAGMSNWVHENERTVEKFLRALKKSESFIKENPDEAITIMSSFTKLDKETLRAIWPTFSLTLNLDSRLVPTMERQAKWAKETGKAPRESVMLDFRSFIFDSLLHKVAPSAVSL